MSLYWNYPHNIRNIRMYSVVYPELNFGGFSGMVPEWFQKRSIYHLRIYWGNLMRIQFPVTVSAKVCVILSVVLKSYFRGLCQVLGRKCKLSAYQFHNTFLGFPESVRTRSVDDYLTESISVIVIKIWLRVMAQIVF